MKRWMWWLIGGGVLAFLGLVVAPYVYVNVISDDPPEKLKLSEPTGTTVTLPEGTKAELAGNWEVGDDSTAGYRVTEVLFGQDNEAAGRTESVTGTMTIDGTTVETAKITVDMTSIASDDDRRDGQFQGRIMNTTEFPTATFTLTDPIDLASTAEGKQVAVDATGDFTLRGVTKSVTVPLKAQRTGNVIEVNGTIPVAWVDYDIPDPSFTGISVQDHGEVEFLLKFTPAAN